MKTSTRCVAIAALALTLGASSSMAQAQPGRELPAPPAPAAMVAMTNAMLRSADGPAALPSGPSEIASMIPTGGQDPWPICLAAGRYNPVTPVATGAIGYQAMIDATTRSGRQGRTLTQVVYQYGSEAVARAYWDLTSSQVLTSCPGSRRTGGLTSTVRATRWTPDQVTSPISVSTVSRDSRGAIDRATFVTVSLVGDTIQMLVLSSAGSAVTGEERTAAEGLTVTLAGRLYQRSMLPITQDPLLTAAQSSMLTTADIPATLPVTTPADGGWYLFDAARSSAWAPGLCFGSEGALPTGMPSFTVSIGGEGDVFSIPGQLSQSSTVYASAARARAAWNAYTAAAAQCSQQLHRPFTSPKTLQRVSNGVSALAVDGVPGVWVRTLDTYLSSDGSCDAASGGTGGCDAFTQRTYSIALLVGRSIQVVDYVTATTGIRVVPLDQAAVNAVAETLAGRWMDSAP